VQDSTFDMGKYEASGLGNVGTRDRLLGVSGRSRLLAACVGSCVRGQVIGQTVILTVLAAIVFGSAVFLSYRFLGWLLD
jgi:hypothetical protein